jgi:hypothetical protein
MKPRIKLRVWVPFVAIVCVASLGYVFRGDIRQAWSSWRAPVLPVAVKYHAPSSVVASATGQDSLIEGGTATSQHFILDSSPAVVQNVDPLADNGPLPGKVNLAVPFTSQAPTGDWSMPYQEACEEASAIMVDAFYRDVSGPIPADQATAAIKAIVAYEMKTLGFYKDTTAAQTVQFIKGYFGYHDVVVKPFTNINDVKRAVANGFPVIIPADGKLLPNPNFRNGGPLYHMLVVKGYTDTLFITNDPGTHNGADFTYTFAALQKAAHDWDTSSGTANAPPVMIIMIPNPSL